jgi:hypothetical protein
VVPDSARGELLSEVANLVESPTVVLGGFDQAFLSLPRWERGPGGGGWLLCACAARCLALVGSPAVVLGGYDRAFRGAQLGGAASVCSGFGPALGSPKEALMLSTRPERAACSGAALPPCWVYHRGLCSFRASGPHGNRFGCTEVLVGLPQLGLTAGLCTNLPRLLQGGARDGDAEAPALLPSLQTRVG